MTDAELTRACGEKIMGWDVKQLQGSKGTDGMIELQPKDRPLLMWWPKCQGGDGRSWNPLASDADAFILVDKIGERYSDLSIEKSGGNWTVTISFAWTATDLDRRRAIVLAVLATVEVKA